MKKMQEKVFVIGLDGATFDLIIPWVEQGYLPNISKLMCVGAYGNLESTIQPLTAPAWTTFLTGMNQAKHGLFDFVKRQHGSYAVNVTNSTHIFSPSIFEIASAVGKKVISINVPYTVPPRPVNGFMVGGPFAPALTPDIVFPQSYYNKIKETIPDYFILPEYESHADDPLLSYASKLMQSVEQRKTLGLQLLRTEEWDLFMIVFMAIDEVQHAFWHFHQSSDTKDEKYKYIIRDIYQCVDRAIGEMIALIDSLDLGGNLTITIVSDHGAGPLQWLVNLNRFLADNKFLTFYKKQNYASKRIKIAVVKQVTNIYRQRVPAKIRRIARTKLGLRKFESIKGNIESTLLTSAIDWPNTLAYALGAGGNIYINLEGREPQGIVKTGDMYEQVCTEIITQLESLVGPDENKIVEKVYRREEIYSGQYLSMAPDLIIKWRDYSYWGRGRYDSSNEPLFHTQNKLDFSAMPLTGTHKPEGILIISGPKIRSDLNIEGARILDMAPTILSLLGVLPGEIMDGTLLEEIFTPETLQEIKKNLQEYQLDSDYFVHKYDSEIEEKITQHLQSLGYM